MYSGNRFFHLGIPLLSLLFCLLACERSGDETLGLGGGGHDTETLTGMVSLPSGNPAIGAMVKLVPADFDPNKDFRSRILTAETNERGEFEFQKIPRTQKYNLIAGKSKEVLSGKLWAYANDIKADKDPKKLMLDSALVFQFALSSATYEKADSGIAYFPGTDILTRCKSGQLSSVDSIPKGLGHFIVTSRAGWSHDTTLVAKRDTVLINVDKSGIRYSP